jgi:hypothetical protein
VPLRSLSPPPPPPFPLTRSLMPGAPSDEAVDKKKGLYGTTRARGDPVAESLEDYEPSPSRTSMARAQIPPTTRASEQHNGLVSERLGPGAHVQSPVGHSTLQLDSIGVHRRY